MVGILSSIENECDEFLGQHAYQFRGMAVLEAFQHQGLRADSLLKPKNNSKKNTSQIYFG